MEFKYITLFLCICAVSTYPSKPLNDRPSELAWQAWLLVDSQNQPSETDRRITPKSVFIAPKLGQSNVSLPDCADGYRSDAMGRCIKFVKVDEAAHLDFLLQKLNAMYATRPSDGNDDEVKPTSGPLQVNIPLGVEFAANDEPSRDPEIAIIVAPTNGNFEVEETDVKFNVKRTHENSNTTKDSVPMNADSQPGIKQGTSPNSQQGSSSNSEHEVHSNSGLDYKPKVEVSVNSEQKFDSNSQGSSSNSEHKSHSNSGNTDQKISSSNQGIGFSSEQNNVENSTGLIEDETIDPLPETTTVESITSDGLQALFFLVPMNDSSHVQSNSTADDGAANTSDTPVSQTAAELQIDSTANSTPIDINTEPPAVEVKGKPDLDTIILSDVASPVDPNHSEEYQSGFVRFPNIQTPVHFPAQPIQQHFVSGSFEAPTETTSFKTQDAHRLSSGEIQDLFRQYIQQNPEVVALTSSEKHPVRRRPESEATFTDGDDFLPQVPRPQYYSPPSFNHRNRDRNSEFWRTDDTQHKLLLLRFGRYPPSGTASRFSSERAVDGHKYYGERQQQGFSNVFGRTRRRGNVR